MVVQRTVKHNSDKLYAAHGSTFASPILGRDDLVRCATNLNSCNGQKCLLYNIDSITTFEIVWGDNLSFLKFPVTPSIQHYHNSHKKHKTSPSRAIGQDQHLQDGLSKDLHICPTLRSCVRNLRNSRSKPRKLLHLQSSPTPQDRPQRHR